MATMIARLAAFECIIDFGLACPFRYRNQCRVQFGGKLDGLKMMRAQRKQQNDRDWDTDQPQENGTHDCLLSSPPPHNRFGLDRFRER